MKKKCSQNLAKFLIFESIKELDFDSSQYYIIEYLVR